MTVVVTAAVCAVVAGYRAYTAIAEWVADVPDATVLAMGIAPDRRPSEAMIRRLLHALDPDLLTAAIGVWLAGRLERRGCVPAGDRGRRQDLAGMHTTETVAQHVLAACDQNTTVVLAGTEVDGKTNEITRFAPLLDQISDLHDTAITADALHCQRDHITYLAKRGANWIVTVKGNPPSLHRQLAGLLWNRCPTPLAPTTADTAGARSAR